MTGLIHTLESIPEEVKQKTLEALTRTNYVPQRPVEDKISFARRVAGKYGQRGFHGINTRADVMDEARKTLYKFPRRFLQKDWEGVNLVGLPPEYVNEMPKAWAHYLHAGVAVDRGWLHKPIIQRIGFEKRIGHLIHEGLKVLELEGGNMPGQGTIEDAIQLDQEYFLEWASSEKTPSNLEHIEHMAADRGYNGVLARLEDETGGYQQSLF